MKKENCLFFIGESDNVLHVKLNGEIDHHNAVSVRVEIDNKIKKILPKKTVIDLSDIAFMDSSGLGLVMGRYTLMQRIGGELAVLNPNKRVMDIFKLAGLQKIVKIENRTNKKMEDKK